MPYRVPATLILSDAARPELESWGRRHKTAQGLALRAGIVLRAADGFSNTAMHFTPTSASWINQVERWFGLLTERAIRRGVHRSVADLERDIHAFIAATNAEPKPFCWVKSADDILASIKRFCLRALVPDTSNAALSQTSESGY